MCPAIMLSSELYTRFILQDRPQRDGCYEGFVSLSANDRVMVVILKHAKIQFRISRISY